MRYIKKFESQYFGYPSTKNNTNIKSVDMMSFRKKLEDTNLYTENDINKIMDISYSCIEGGDNNREENTLMTYRDPRAFGHPSK